MGSGLLAVELDTPAAKVAPEIQQERDIFSEVSEEEKNEAGHAHAHLLAYCTLILG